MLYNVYILVIEITRTDIHTLERRQIKLIKLLTIYLITFSVGKNMEKLVERAVSFVVQRKANWQCL